MKSVGVCSSRFSFPENLYNSFIMARYNSSERDTRGEWRRQLESEQYRNYVPSPSVETVSEWQDEEAGGRSRSERSERSESSTCCAAYRSNVLSDLIDTGIVILYL